MGVRFNSCSKQPRYWCHTEFELVKSRDDNDGENSGEGTSWYDRRTYQKDGIHTDWCGPRGLIGSTWKFLRVVQCSKRTNFEVSPKGSRLFWFDKWYRIPWRYSNRSIPYISCTRLTPLYLLHFVFDEHRGIIDEIGKEIIIVGTKNDPSTDLISDLRNWRERWSTPVRWFNIGCVTFPNTHTKTLHRKIFPPY